MNAIAQALDELLNGDARPKLFGFCLLVFPFGEAPEGRINYICNAERSDMIASMKEFIARNEGRLIEHEEKQ